MHDDPSRYWQDLTDNYRRMSDGELLQLAEKPEDLTDVAQQVLRDEMRLRRLDRPRQAAASPRAINTPRKESDLLAGTLAGSKHLPSGLEDLDDENDDDEPAFEYTWKTLLCDCESNERALQLRAALARHGIESWVTQVPANSIDVLGPQVHVAADQLEQAQAIAAQPIPQDIIDDWNTPVPEFETPACPRCGSKEEVVLEGTEPMNAWVCEACGGEWTDPESGDEGTPLTR